MKNYFKDVKRVNFFYICFYDLRYMYVILLLLKDINVKVIFECLGYSKILVILDIYSYVIFSM